MGKSYLQTSKTLNMHFTKGNRTAKTRTLKNYQGKRYLQYGVFSISCNHVCGGGVAGRSLRVLASMKT